MLIYRDDLTKYHKTALHRPGLIFIKTSAIGTVRYIGTNTKLVKHLDRAFRTLNKIKSKEIL
jgi:hypothetical protein